MEYRFGSEEETHDYDSFDEYLSAATMGCKSLVHLVRSDHFLKFFNYYRSSLETELNAIQEQHATLMSIIFPNTILAFIKVNPNQAILNIAAYLEDSKSRHQGFADIK